MAGLDARVFGRMAPSAVAKDVMTAPSLNLTPSPAQPADVVEHPNLGNYYNALDACYEILKQEHDPHRRLRVEECRSFFEGVIALIEEPDTTAQAPAPSSGPGMPPALAAPMGAPTPPPGLPPAPPPGGAAAGASGGPVPSVPAVTTSPAA